MVGLFEVGQTDPVSSQTMELHSHLAFGDVLNQIAIQAGSSTWIQ